MVVRVFWLVVGCSERLLGSCYGISVWLINWFERLLGSCDGISGWLVDKLV